MTAKYHQENKERLLKEARERFQNVSKEVKEERKKSENMVLNVTKTSQKMKSKGLLSIEKNMK